MPRNVSIHHSNFFKQKYSYLESQFNYTLGKIKKQYPIEACIIMYECTFLKLLRNKYSAIGKYFGTGSDLPKIPPRLRVRESLFGGNTEIYVLAAAVAPSDDIECKYFDYNSLYPNMCIEVINSN